jgi:hypothetical protein
VSVPAHELPSPKEEAPQVRQRRWLKGVTAGVLVMLAFLAATNHWYGWREGIRAIQAFDVDRYATIARAAPEFPHIHIGSAFTERFAFPWILGSGGDLLGAEPQTPFRVMFALFVLVTVGLLVDICRRLDLGVTATLLCVGVFALNPYVFRVNAIGPTPVDEAFVIGTAIVMWGLVTVRFAGVFAGAVISILGRQTALLAIPAAAAWLYAGSGWRGRPTRQRVASIALPVAIVAILYAVIKLSITSFTVAYAPSIPGDTVIPVIGHPGGASTFAAHIARTAVPLVLWAGAVGGVFVGLVWAGRRLRPPVEFWCAVLIGASISVQPLAISPEFAGFEANEQRLSALGLFPLCVALAYLLREARPSLRDAPLWALGAGGAALLAASLKDQLTTVGPQTNGQLAALELLAAAVLGCTLAVVIRTRRTRPSQFSQAPEPSP